MKRALFTAAASVVVFGLGLVATGLVTGATGIRPENRHHRGHTTTTTTTTVPATSTVTTTVPATTTTTTTTVPTSTTTTTTPGSCTSPWAPAFRSPGACGYPDPAYGNVGVPSGTTLTPHGAFATSSMCSANGPCTIAGLDITGDVPPNQEMVLVDTNNVTFVNDRFTGTGQGCGPDHHCSNSLVFQEKGVSGLTFSDDEFTSNPTITVEFAVQQYGNGFVNMDHVYQHGPVDTLCWCIGGNISDSYSIVHLAMADDHLENIYSETSSLTVNHSVLLNAELHYTQGAVFAQTAAGANIPCANHITLTNDLFAGGGDTLDLCSHSTSVGSAVLTVTNNRFARCVTTPVGPDAGGQWHCSGGADQYGYFPFSGAYAPDYDMYCSSSLTTWSGNQWDNDGSTVGC